MFWENFYSLCRENNRKPLQVVNQLGIASGSITMWKNGTRPSEKNLRKLAEYFGVTPDYFFVDHSVHAEPETQNDSPLIRDIIVVVKELSADKQNQLLRYARFLTSEQ